MKRIHTILCLATALGAALPVAAMPIGLRTAVWGVSGANSRTAVTRLLPESGGAAGIGPTLAALSDRAVAANIADTDTDEYEAFRQWAIDSGARAETLRMSPTAWFSFVTASPVLVGKAITSDDVRIESFAPAAVGGPFDLTVGIDGVAVGAAARAERLQTVFDVEGAATLDTRAFSAGNVTLEAVSAEDGKVRFSVKPNDPDRAAFFLRVRVKP